MSFQILEMLCFFRNHISMENYAFQAFLETKINPESTMEMLYKIDNWQHLNPLPYCKTLLGILFLFARIVAACSMANLYKIESICFLLQLNRHSLIDHLNTKNISLDLIVYLITIWHNYTYQIKEDQIQDIFLIANRCCLENIYKDVIIHKDVTIIITSILQHWKQFVIHYTQIRKQCLQSWIKQWIQKKLLSRFIKQWKSIVIHNQRIRQKQHNKIKQCIVVWKEFIRLKQRRLKKWKQKEIKKQRNARLLKLTQLLQFLQMKKRIQRIITKWIFFTKQKIRLKIIVQNVKIQWLMEYVYPTRLVNIQMECGLIKFFIKLLNLCTSYFYAISKNQKYKKLTIVFEQLLLPFSETNQTIDINNIIKTCDKLITSKFYRTTYDLLHTKQMIKYASTYSFFEDFLNCIKRFTKGVQLIPTYIPEFLLPEIYKKVFYKRHTFSLHEMIKWYKDCNIPAYASFLREANILLAVKTWLIETTKRSETKTSIIALLTQFVPNFLLEPQKESKEQKLNKQKELFTQTYIALRQKNVM